MKKVTDLKDNEAIRVNKEEWPKIIKLFSEADGSCWDKYSGFNPIAYNDIKGDVVIYPHCGGWDKIEHNAADKTYPASDFLLPEQQFIVGQSYEFSDPIEDGWVKGVLLAVIEDDYKYIARIGNDREPSGWQLIRPIQPASIERWINMSKSGNQVGKKCYASEIEACQHAPQSQNVFQVKLTGSYTI